MRYIKIPFASLALLYCLNVYSELIEANSPHQSNDEKILENDNTKSNEQSIDKSSENNKIEQFKTKREPNDDIDYPIKPVVIDVKPKQEQIIENNGEEKLPKDSYNVLSFNEAAMLFAGMLESDKLDKNYEEYSKNITARWDNLSKVCFEKLKLWRDENLVNLDQNKFVFYPFGGPDIAHAVMIFPYADNYILVGQEEQGDPDSLLRSCTKTSLLSLEKSEDNFFKKGYFVTSYMVSDLRNKNVKGVLPIALLTLAKLGYQIVSVENLKIVSKINDSIKIVFKDVSTNLEKTLYYVKCNLANDSKNLSNLLKFVNDTLGNQFITFLKSSSYSLHRVEFSKIRQYLIDNSFGILQDDTGIRFKDIDKNIFDVKLFGSYEYPALNVFKGFKQTALVNAYKTDKVIPLNFGIGYIGDHNAVRQNYKNINLQLYIRKSPAIIDSTTIDSTTVESQKINNSDEKNDN